MTSVLLIFVVIIGVLQLEAVPVSNNQIDEVGKNYCGKQLSDNLSLICQGRFYTYPTKRSLKNGLYLDIFN